MKPIYLFPLASFVIVGCGSSVGASDAPTAETKMTAQQKIDKINSDPKVPDGLKQIQTHTLQRESGTK